MANRILSPDNSLSLLVLRLRKAGISPCHIYSLSDYRFTCQQDIFQIYRSKGFTNNDIKTILDAKLSAMQVWYVEKKDEILQKQKKTIEELRAKLDSNPTLRYLDSKNSRYWNWNNSSKADNNWAIHLLKEQIEIIERQESEAKTKAEQLWNDVKKNELIVTIL